MRQPLRLSRSFFKAHGHGNDYLVFQEGSDWPVTGLSVPSVCHRQRGVGGDGIVAILAQGTSHGPAGTRPGPFRARMFNPDGSEFERSGNGLRILGAYLFSRGWVGQGEGFPVEVGGDVVTMEILEKLPGGLLNVAVDMGEARFGMAAVGGRKEDLAQEPAEPPGRSWGSLPGPDGRSVSVQPVSVGNPHCVVFREDLSEGDLLELGPHLAVNPAFPSGTNVQLARVSGPGQVEILIWERGVGRTASSGTSACAVASACVHQERLHAGRIEVLMEGGAFSVTVSTDLGVRLEGPVHPVLEGELTDQMLGGLG